MNKRSTTMSTALGLLLIATVTAGTAQAGWLDRGKSTKADEVVKPGHFDRLPALEFAAGVLSIDGFGRYQVGQCSLSFDESSERQRKNHRSKLRLGQQLIVSGHPQPDGTLLVTRIMEVAVQPADLAGAALDEPLVGELPPTEPN